MRTRMAQAPPPLHPLQRRRHVRLQLGQPGLQAHRVGLVPPRGCHPLLVVHAVAHCVCATAPSVRLASLSSWKRLRTTRVAMSGHWPVTRGRPRDCSKHMEVNRRCCCVLWVPLATRGCRHCSENAGMSDYLGSNAQQWESRDRARDTTILEKQ